MILVNINGQWVEGQPQEGELYRIVKAGIILIESYWSEPETDDRLVYTLSNVSVTKNGEPLTQFAGNYYCEANDTIQLSGSITDAQGNTVTAITVPITVKMPLVRHANAQPTQDEIYLNVTLEDGVMTATGKIERSGDWKILIERVNEALKRIGGEWKIQHPDVTFLA